jgi:hypothetical protein
MKLSEIAQTFEQEIQRVIKTNEEKNINSVIYNCYKKTI